MHMSKPCSVSCVAMLTASARPDRLNRTIIASINSCAVRYQMTVLHHTTAQHITAQHSKTQYSTHIAAQHTTPHHITAHHITSHHITSHHITSHHITSTSNQIKSHH